MGKLTTDRAINFNEKKIKVNDTSSKNNDDHLFLQCLPVTVDVSVCLITRLNENLNRFKTNYLSLRELLSAERKTVFLVSL